MRGRTATIGAAVLAWLVCTPGAALAHGGEAPAGGAPLEDLIPAAIVGGILTVAIAVFGWAHRTGRTSLLDRVGRFSERVSGLPAFAALPLGLAGASLLVAVFGFYWDVATHIDMGRDPGPFANPSHWFIIFGLLGIALAGVFSALLGTSEDLPSAVRVRDDWYVPVGSILLLVCGVIALAGFPLDDVWHRIFGQDVTLWSPTHIQMVGGASLSTLALWVLFIEGRRAPSRPSRPVAMPRLTSVLLAGAFLIGASTVQGEFDYAVPQFRLLYQPVLIGVAAAIALVPARIRLGRGGALAAVAFFLLVRIALTVIITPILGRVTFHFPLYLGAALAVEAVAWRVPPRRQITFGAWAGLAVGTVGLAVEWGWSHIGMPIPWPAVMLPETVLVAVPAAVAAGVVGGFIGRALLSGRVARQSPSRWVAPAAGLVVIAALIYPLPMTTIPGAEAHVSLEEVSSDPREVHATIRLEPRDLAEDAEYLNVTAWQGAEWTRDNSFIDPLERQEQGVYSTTRPIPVHGEWKALIRMNNGSAMVASPIFLPEDQAIPAEEVPAEEEFTREFVEGRELLLREARPAPGWLTATAYAITVGIIVAWVAVIGWGLSRLRRSSSGEPQGVERRSERQEEPVSGE